MKVPTAVGLKEAVAAKLVPGCMTKPAAGMPVTLNGAAGAVTVCTVNGWAPVLEKVALPVAERPTAMPPKLMGGVGADLCVW